MKAKLIVGSLLLGGAAEVAPAQTASPSDRAERNRQAVAETAGAASTLVDMQGKVLSCGEVAAQLLKAKQAVSNWEQAGRVLGHLGNATTAVSVGANVAAGNHVAAAEEFGKFAVDSAICSSVGPALCPSYMVGKGIGDLLNYVPKAVGMDRTLNDMWTDVVYDFAIRPSQDAKIERALKRFEANRQKLKAQQESDSERHFQCLKAQEPRSAVQEILDRARSRVASSSSFEQSSSGLASAASEAAEAASTSIGAVSDTATMSRIQQDLAIQRQAQQSWSARKAQTTMAADNARVQSIECNAPCTQSSTSQSSSDYEYGDLGTIKYP